MRPESHPWQVVWSVRPSAQRQEEVAGPSVPRRVAVVQPLEQQRAAVAAQPWVLPEGQPWAQQVASAQPLAARMELAEAELPLEVLAERPWAAEAEEPSVRPEERLLEVRAEPGERLAAVLSVQPAAQLSGVPSALPSSDQAALLVQR